ncbi:MAG: hypothetical protein AAGD43_30060, partial [Pseudomonadota bacterium]
HVGIQDRVGTGAACVEINLIHATSGANSICTVSAIQSVVASATRQVVIVSICYPSIVEDNSLRIRASICDTFNTTCICTVASAADQFKGVKLIGVDAGWPVVWTSSPFQ